MEEDKSELKEQENTAVQVVEKPEVNEEKIELKPLEKQEVEGENTPSTEKKKSKLGLILVITVIMLFVTILLQFVISIANKTRRGIEEESAVA